MCIGGSDSFPPNLPSYIQNLMTRLIFYYHNYDNELFRISKNCIMKGDITFMKNNYEDIIKSKNMK